MKQPELGKKIADLRKAKGLTQEELVGKCNLNVRTLQRIESGEVTPRSYTIRSIFTAVGYEFKSSPETAPGNLRSTGFTLSQRLEQFTEYLIDLFNLKTNTMKKISILSFFLMLIALVTLGLNAYSQPSRSNPLLGKWKLVAVSHESFVMDGSIHEGPKLKIDDAYTRVLEFKSDRSFESRSVQNTIYNKGLYSLLDDKSYVTVHREADGSLSSVSNLYSFEITNDILHFVGFYLRETPGVEHKYCEKVIVDEWWESVKDTQK